MVKKSKTVKKKQKAEMNSISRKKRNVKKSKKISRTRSKHQKKRRTSKKGGAAAAEEEREWKQIESQINSIIGEVNTTNPIKEWEQIETEINKIIGKANTTNPIERKQMEYEINSIITPDNIKLDNKKENIVETHKNISEGDKLLMFLLDIVRGTNNFETIELEKMDNQATEKKNEMETLWKPVFDELKKTHGKREERKRKEHNEVIKSIVHSINEINKDRILIITSTEIEDKNKTDELKSRGNAIDQLLKILKEYNIDDKTIVKISQGLQTEIKKHLSAIKNITPPHSLIALLTKYVNLKKHDQQLPQEEIKKLLKYENEYPAHYNAALTTVIEHQEDFNLVDYDNLQENKSDFTELLQENRNMNELLFKINLQSLLNIYAPNNYYQIIKKEYFNYYQIIKKEYFNFARVWITSNSENSQEKKREKEFKKTLSDIIYDKGLKYLRQIYIMDDINGATNFATGEASKSAVLDYYKNKDLMFLIISELERKFKKTPMSTREIYNKMNEHGFSIVTEDDMILKQILFGEIKEIFIESFKSNWIKQGISKKVINAKNIYTLIDDLSKNPGKFITQPELANTIKNGNWRNITDEQFKIIKQVLIERLKIANTAFNSHLNENQLQFINSPASNNRVKQSGNHGGNKIGDDKRVEKKKLADSVIKYKEVFKDEITSARATNNNIVQYVTNLINEYPNQEIIIADELYRSKHGAAPPFRKENN